VRVKNTCTGQVFPEYGANITSRYCAKGLMQAELHGCVEAGMNAASVKA